MRSLISLAIVILCSGCSMFDPGGQTREALKMTTTQIWTADEYNSHIAGGQEGEQLMIEADPANSKVTFARMQDGTLIPITVEGFSALLHTNTNSDNNVAAGTVFAGLAAQQFGEMNKTVRAALEKIPDSGDASTAADNNATVRERLARLKARMAPYREEDPTPTDPPIPDP